jgi:hypothetical protein
MALSSNDLFKAIGAPLKNAYSWGAIHANGNIVLRVWRDEAKKEKDLGQYRFRLTCYGVWDNLNTFQVKEREEHIRLIREGASGYMIIHTSDIPETKCGPRTIKTCERDRIWEIDKIIEVTDEETGKNYWGLAKPSPLEITPDFKIDWD